MPLQITDCLPKMYTASTSLTSNIPPFETGNDLNINITTFDARDLYNYLIILRMWFLHTDTFSFLFSWFCFHFIPSLLLFCGQFQWHNFEVTLLACTVCLRGTNMTLLCNSENGAFLLNLPSHPRTAHKHTLRCLPTRKGTHDASGEPRTTPYCAISVEIVCRHIPHACRHRPPYDTLATTSCTPSRIQV